MMRKREYEVCLLFLLCWMSVSETLNSWTLQINHPPQITDPKHGFIYLGKVFQTLRTCKRRDHPTIPNTPTDPLCPKCLLQVTMDLASKETCASAPLAAGIIALALEANPTLTWRDVWYIMIRVSRPAGLRTENWHPNGMGRLVSHYFGYGRLDADKLIGLARKWRSVQIQRKCCRDVMTRPSGKFTLRWNKTACQGSGNLIQFLEHVRLHLTLTNTQCGHLIMSLSPVQSTSPMRTNSKLLTVRALDWFYASCHDWTFVWTQFCDDVPAGHWVLQIESTNNLNRSGLTSPVQLGLYGSKKQMIHHRLRRQSVQNCEVKDQYGTCEVCAYPYYLYKKFCLVSCPHHQYEEEGNSSRPSRTCFPCHHTCNTCFGPLNTQCLTCPPYSTRNTDEGTCNRREYPWERNRRRQEAKMWITLALFAGSLLILVLSATVVSCISCRMRKDRINSAQTEAVNLEIVETSDV